MTDLAGLASYAAFFLAFAGIFAVIVLGLNLHWGFTGLFNVGVAGFVAIGAYVSAILTTPDHPGQLGGFALPVVVGWLGAAAAAGLAGLIVGAATLRLRHDYLAIATFGIAIVIQLVALNAQWLTGGPFGLHFVPKPFEASLGAGLPFNAAYLALVVGVVLLVHAGLERLVRSPWGRVLRAIREDETAAIALGKSAQRFRLEAFVLGSTLMGLAGALYVSFIGFVSPFDFLPILTFQVWAMLIVGGSGNNRGALLGTLVVWGIWAASGVTVSKLVPPSHAAQGAAIQVILIGLVLVLMLLYRPQGLLPEKQNVSREARLKP